MNQENDRSKEFNYVCDGIANLKIADISILAQYDNRLVVPAYVLYSQADKLMKPTLIVNQNCHSCALLGHPFLLSLDHYQIEYREGRSAEFPLLQQDGHEYRGLELQRKIFQKINITDLSDEKLAKTIVNDHRNCLHD